ncbi:MAG: hypothetical protein WBE82_06105 [Xanthobacteraceae bacterium]
MYITGAEKFAIDTPLSIAVGATFMSPVSATGHVIDDFIDTHPDEA